MREFVEQDHAAAVLSPAGCVGGHEDGGAEDSEGHGHASSFGFDDVHGTVNAEGLGEGLTEVEFARAEGRGSAAETPDGGAGHQHLREHDGRACGPEEHEAQLPVERLRRGFVGRREVGRLDGFDLHCGGGLRCEGGGSKRDRGGGAGGGDLQGGEGDSEDRQRQHGCGGGDPDQMPGGRGRAPHQECQQASCREQSRALERYAGEE